MKLVLVAAFSAMSFAPPEIPSYWTEPNEENMESLLRHCTEADEITVEDAKLVMTLAAKSLTADFIKAYVNEKIKVEPERRMSWDDVRFELEKCEKIMRGELKKREEENKKKANEPQPSRGRDA